MDQRIDHQATARLRSLLAQLNAANTPKRRRLDTDAQAAMLTRHQLNVVVLQPAASSPAWFDIDFVIDEGSPPRPSETFQTSSARPLVTESSDIPLRSPTKLPQSRLFTDEERQQMIKNHNESLAAGHHLDHVAVVKLDAAFEGHFWLTELSPIDLDTAFCLRASTRETPEVELLTVRVSDLIAYWQVSVDDDFYSDQCLSGLKFEMDAEYASIMAEVDQICRDVDASAERAREEGAKARLAADIRSASIARGTDKIQ